MTTYESDKEVVRRKKDHAKFLKNYVVDSSGCWLWTRSKTKLGYAQFFYAGKMSKGHRYAYSFFKGPIPKDKVLDHLCRVRHCVNPDHLELVTNRENVLRGISSAATNAKKTHCKRGHELSGSNVFLCKKGGGRWRECKKCKVERNRILKAKKRQKHDLKTLLEKDN